MCKMLTVLNVFLLSSSIIIVVNGGLSVDFPSSVDVSEGSPIVVCFTADFRNFSESGVELLLTLEVNDITTCKLIDGSIVLSIAFRFHYKGMSIFRCWFTINIA